MDFETLAPVKDATVSFLTAFVLFLRTVLTDKNLMLSLTMGYVTEQFASSVLSWITPFSYSLIDALSTGAGVYLGIRTWEHLELEKGCEEEEEEEEKEEEPKKKEGKETETNSLDVSVKSTKQE